jgi:ribonuclease HI
MYPDGAGSLVLGRGGWGTVLLCGGQVKELGGSDTNTTNNRMEFRAALEGLLALTRPCKVRVWTDSQLLIGYMSLGWKSRNVALSGLRDEITRAIQEGGHEVEWHWIRGHDGNPHNARADQLAGAALKEGTP